MSQQFKCNKCKDTGLINIQLFTSVDVDSCPDCTLPYDNLTFTKSSETDTKSNRKETK